MKKRNLLKAYIRIDGFDIDLSCRKVKGGYMWYGNGAGATNLQIDADLYESLWEAKCGLVTTYPPLRYDMKASWL